MKININELSDFKKIKHVKDLKRVTFGKPIAVGFIFGIMFWLVFDSFVMGIALGLVFMIGMSEEEKRKSSKAKAK